jgi:hypothetical protein
MPKKHNNNPFVQFLRKFKHTISGKNGAEVVIKDMEAFQKKNPWVVIEYGNMLDLAKNYQEITYALVKKAIQDSKLTTLEEVMKGMGEWLTKYVKSEQINKILTELSQPIIAAPTPLNTQALTSAVATTQVVNEKQGNVKIDATEASSDTDEWHKIDPPVDQPTTQIGSASAAVSNNPATTAPQSKSTSYLSWFGL